ncbi:hypothetical protein K504DRAFT_481810 [Pleomassaria siparia CBS 279.74]|uniref:Zn(2)-C6 fungal-type domain-containing protein n=1 Tax=Pleomassaria siparia CBS 279.74 TaxID=1314801 RepID=A0A6G1K922_9PLEO|nr:hypothetical protein K504DRAFT_481810 [Pleomassaria siparia CBS 279.74]
MSYRGRPSKGCESCRARKVKCDETRPSCSRCSKSNSQCKYRDQGDLLFRNQTTIAAQKAESSWRKRAKSHQRSPSASIASIASSASHHSSPRSTRESPPSLDRRASPPRESWFEVSSSIPIFNKLSIGYQVQPDLQRLAYERFIYDFVVFDSPSHDPNQPSSALWDFIPPLYQAAEPDSSLATIVHAVSYANFSARCNAPHAQALGEECLARGFKLLQKTLSDKDQAPSDHALCAVYLLGVWEQLSSSCFTGNYLAHKEGANALLQLRTMEEFYSNPVSARLYEVSFAQMLIGNLHHAKPPSLPIRNLVVARKLLPSLHNTSGIYVIQLIHKEATLHATWDEIKSSSNPPSSRQELQEMLRQTLELDAEFQTWEDTIPPAWKYQMERNTPEARSTYEPKWRDLILDSRGAPEEIHSYATLKKCWIWSFYRTTRLLLLRDLVEMLNWMLKMPEDVSSGKPLNLPTSASTMPGTVPAQPLDNVTLSIHHAFAISHLVKVIEKGCSAILGTFTVPIYGKSNEDVVGLRGFTSFWALGMMDSALRSGLVPDSASPPTPPSSTTASSESREARAIFQFHKQPAPSVYKLPSQNSHPLYHNLATTVPNSQDFPGYPSPPCQLSPINHATPPETPPSTNVSLPIDYRISGKHPFDSRPPHPNDASGDLPMLNFSITKPSSIDVAARREWINRLLYYMGTKLGIKKGLGIVISEGYMEVTKRDIDRIFGG